MGTSTTIRIATRSRDTLRALSEQTGMKQQELVDRAVESLRREIFLENANQAFEKAQKNALAWKGELAERAEWDETLTDGLEDDG